MDQSVKIVVHTDEDGSLWAEVPDYPGVFASGSDMDELLEATVEALNMVLSDGDAHEPSADVLPLAARRGRKIHHATYNVRGVELDLIEA